MKLPLTSAGLLVERDGAAVGADGDLRPNVARLVSRTEGTAEYVDVVERTGDGRLRPHPGNLAAQLLPRDLGAGRTESSPSAGGRTSTTSGLFTGEHIELAQYYPEDDEYLEPRSPHYEVASPADDGALPHTFREDRP